MNVKPLLDFIGWPESRNNYDAFYGGIADKHRPPKPLTKMTIGEVLDWQDSIDPLYPSEAAGKYQILEDTLRGLYRQAGLSRAHLFDKKTQDFLATQLLLRRGLTDYMAGRISAYKFANSLAKEWASLPVVTDVRRGERTIKKGQSYYAGDGLNKSHVKVPAFLSAVQAVKEVPNMPIPQPPDAPPAPPKPLPDKGRLPRWLRRIIEVFE